MAISPRIGINLHGDAITVSPKVNTCDPRQPIGVVYFADLHDPTGMSVQSCNVDHLLAVADAFQEAARRLRAAQIAGDITIEQPRISA